MRTVRRIRPWGPVLFCVWMLVFTQTAISLPGPGSGITRDQSRGSRPALLHARSHRSFEKAVEHYNAGRYYSALDIFRRLTALPPSRNPQLTACYLMTMKSYYHVGNLAGAIEVGRESLSKFPDSSYRGYIHECFGDVFVKQGRYRLATESYLKARGGTDSGLLIRRVDDKLAHLSEGLLTGEEIEDLLVFESDSSTRTILMLMVASTLLARGDPDAAAFALLKMDTAILPPHFLRNYEDLRRRTYMGSGEAVIVGVVLPLSGYDEKMGKAFLSGLQAAVESLQQRLPRTIILQVLDNGGDVLRTVSCMQTLASNPNVVTIVGPISTMNSTVAAATAQRLGVSLLVPISSQVGLSRVGENVFQMNPDLHKQGRYAADYAVRSLGLKTLAVVAPADRFGKELSDGFVQRAEELDAEIVAVQWYSGIPVDLSRQFGSVRKMAFQLLQLQPDAVDQSLQLDSADNTFMISEADFFPEQRPVDQTLSPADSTEMMLESIEGVYLPIHLGDINYVASQFLAHNLDAQLLGNSSWYDPDELGQELIGPNIDGMVVLADHMNRSDEPGEHDLWASDLGLSDRDEYRMAISGYDIMTFLAGQFGDEPTRLSVLENLSQSKSFRGTGRLFSFTDSAPRVNSSLHILEYREGKFIEVGEIEADSLRTYELQSP